MRHQTMIVLLLLLASSGFISLFILPSPEIVTSRLSVGPKDQTTPADPADPADPAGPADSADSTAPTAPTDPTDTTNATTPETPETPTTSTATTTSTTTKARGVIHDPKQTRRRCQILRGKYDSKPRRLVDTTLLSTATEVSMLLLRYEAVADVATAFVVVTADVDFRGARRKTDERVKHFAGLPEFAPYRERIFHIHLSLRDSLMVCPRLPRDSATDKSKACVNSWMRNTLATGVDRSKVSDRDWVIVSDLDEIADPSWIRVLLHCRGIVPANDLREKIVTFNARHDFKYTTQCRLPNWKSDWYAGAHGPRAIRVRGVRQFGIKAIKISRRCTAVGPYATCRNPAVAIRFPNASWHFSAFGGPIAIVEKLKHNYDQMAKADRAESPDFMRSMVNNCSDGFKGGPDRRDAAKLPSFLETYPDVPETFARSAIFREMNHVWARAGEEGIRA